MAERAAQRVGFGEVFAVVEFRGLFAAQVLSVVGDQLARVALAVLVFDRTGSALLTGLVYALGFLPAVVGGPLLGGLADRRPRRQLMIQADLARAALVAGMAFAGSHVVLLCALLVAAELLTAPFGAARAALLTDVLSGERYLVASAIGNITTQSAQVVGFGLGGGLVALLGTQASLLVNAVTFLVSAALLRLWVQARPAPARPAGAAQTVVRGEAVAVARLLLTDRRLRLLVMLALLCGFYVVPEGLAAPYASVLGQGAGTVGLIMAAQPVGAAVGAVLMARTIVPERRLRLMLPLAVLATGALLGFALQPGTATTLGLLALSGLGTSYQLPANAAFVVGVPKEVRGRAFGLVQSGIIAVQGVAFLLAGALAEHVRPHLVIAVAGGLGAAAAAVLTLLHRDPDLR